MKPQLLETVICPACGGRLQLVEPVFSSVQYGDVTCEEVEHGGAACSCGRCYPIEQFVLSFAGLFGPEIQSEAAYWEQYYLWLRNHGSLGFTDLQLGIAPYITGGVAEPIPGFDSKSHYTVHEEIAEHPLVRRGSRLLDLGVGLGWTSFHFAQQGYQVIAIEPALALAQAAKRYALDRGVSIEYICSSVSTVDFVAGSFDTVTAFHSLHHEPSLETELSRIQLWLRHAGVLALDEHIGNSKLAAAIHSQMQQWAEAEILPAYRTIDDEELLKLPPEPHSPHEDIAAHQIVPLVYQMFDVQLCRTRHVLLDHYPLLYYLQHERDDVAFQHANNIVAQFAQWLCSVDPEGGDYATIIAINNADRETAAGPVAEQGNSLAESEPEESVDSGHPPGSQPVHVPASGGLADELRVQIAHLEKQLEEQGRWARSLERDALRKDEELARFKGMFTPGWEATVRRHLPSLRTLFSNKRKRR